MSILPGICTSLFQVRCYWASGHVTPPRLFIALRLPMVQLCSAHCCRGFGSVSRELKLMYRGGGGACESLLYRYCRGDIKLDNFLYGGERRHLRSCIACHRPPKGKECL